MESGWAGMMMMMTTTRVMLSFDGHLSAGKIWRRRLVDVVGVLEREEQRSCFHGDVMEESEKCRRKVEIVTR